MDRNAVLSDKLMRESLFCPWSAFRSAIRADYQFFPTSSDTTTANPTTTEENPKVEKFDTMSFVYGALAGAGGILIVAILIVLLRGRRRKRKMNTYEMNTYVDNDVAA